MAQSTVGEGSFQEISVLCVEDNADVSEILQLTIESEPDMRVAGAIFGADALVETVQKLHPDVYVVDLTLPGGDPLKAVREISAAEGRDSKPVPRAIVYSGYDDPETVEAVLNAGAWGFISKHSDCEDLIQAIRKVARGELVFPKTVLSNQRAL